jgi:2-polyprenyl-6-methoxyphenol hydroxylase-like FAD-dependent oxidoreductase
LGQFGLPALRKTVTDLVPWLSEDIVSLQDWKQTSFLTVQSSRVRRWYRPGLLLIGDAAHVMSPVGGVGINCAIQDAIVTANVLGPRLKTGELSLQDLARVQRVRDWPLRATQACQRLMQRRILQGPTGVPGIIFRFAPTRRLISRVIGLGLHRVQLATPQTEGISRCNRLRSRSTAGRRCST